MDQPLRQPSKLLTGVLAGSCATGMMPGVACMFGQWHWSLDLASHFVAYAALALSLSACVAALSQRWRWALTAVVGASLHGALIVPLYVAGPVREVPATRVRLLVANLLYSNRERVAMPRWIRTSKPDFIVLLELNPSWLHDLGPALEPFSDRIELPRSDAFGIGLYSRSAALQRVELDNPGPPWIVANAKLAGAELSLVAIHSVPPVSERATRMRDSQLRSLARQRHRLAPASVIAGDLNTSSWSGVFRDLVSDAELVDSRIGFGLHGTWPATWIAPLRLPIDHVLTSAGVRVVRREVGPDIGSDHRPVLVELSVPRRNR